MIIDIINYTLVGADDLPVTSIAPAINEAKASMILTDQLYKGCLEKYVDPSFLLNGETMSCNVSYFNRNRAWQQLNQFVIINGNPRFPVVEPNSIFGGYYSKFLYPIEIEGCPSLFRLLKKSAHSNSRQKYSELEQTLHFFGASSLSWGSFPIGERFSMVPLPTFEPIVQFEEQSFEQSFQEQVKNILTLGFQNYISLQIEGFPNRNGMCMSLDYADHYGDMKMRLLKRIQYDGFRLTESYIPLTCWVVKHVHTRPLLSFFEKTGSRELKTYTHCFAPVGFPQHQPLYNLNYIADAETVVLCNSPENAEVLQQANAIEETGIAFSSFVCDPDHYEEVDMDPLKGKHVFLEVANHSGLTLAEAYIEANGLYELLRDVVKVEELHFLQRAIEYPSMVGVRNVDDLVRANRVNPPRVVEDSIKEFDEAEFQDMVEKAKTEIARKTAAMQDLAFWKDEQQAETGSVENTKPVGRITDKIILRPYIIAGTTTLITGAPNVGKSCFKTAMSACIAGSPRKFLEGRFWSRCTPTDANQYKVVDLIFDSDGEEAIADHRRDFASDIGENAVNYVQKDMSGDPINYLKHENYTAFEKILDDCEAREGVPGQRIDVLVLDTLFALSHEANTFHAMNEFIKHLNHDRPYMAVLVLHHLNNQDRAYGGVRVLTGIRAHIKLFRTEEQQEACKGRNPLLSDPFTVAIEKASNNKIPEDGESFAVRFDETQKAFVVAEPEDKEKVHARRKAIVEGYAKQGLTQPEIARLFGVDERTIRNWINKSE